MATELDVTAAAETIADLWRPRLLAARYDKMILGKRCLSVDGDVKAHGDSLKLPIAASVSANAVGTDGSVTNQALTATSATVNLTSWYEATIDVVDRAQRQSIVDLYTAYEPGFAGAMAQNVDGALAALYSSVSTNTAGATSAPYDLLNDDLLCAAIQKLLDTKVPMEDPNDVSFVFHTSCWSHLKKLDKFNNANLTGQAKGGQLEVKVPDIYGIPVFFTTQIKSSSSVRKNLLFHREALGLGFQKNFNIEVLARVRKSQPISADWLYGVVASREDHACVVNTIA